LQTNPAVTSHCCLYQLEQHLAHITGHDSHWHRFCRARQLEPHHSSFDVLSPAATHRLRSGRKSKTVPAPPKYRLPCDSLHYLTTTAPHRWQFEHIPLLGAATRAARSTYISAVRIFQAKLTKLGQRHYSPSSLSEEKKGGSASLTALLRFGPFPFPCPPTPRSPSSANVAEFLAPPRSTQLGKRGQVSCSSVMRRNGCAALRTNYLQGDGLISPNDR